MYADEADLLNVSLFGKTAMQWKRENPDLKGNMRDYATIEQLAIMLYSGMRIREHLALQWGDIDSENQIITIRRALKHAPEGDKIGDTPKSKRIR